MTARVNENDMNSANTRRIRTGKIKVENPVQQYGTITVIRKTGGLGSVYHIEDLITVFGSDPECNIRINNPAILSKHLKIEVDLLNLVLTDLTEKGGVLVNGKPVKGNRILSDGDKITLADRSFIIGCSKVPYRELPNKERKKTLGPRLLRSMTTEQSKRRHSVSKSLFVQVPAEEESPVRDKAVSRKQEPEQNTSGQSEPNTGKRLSQVTYLQLPKETEQLVTDRQLALQNDLSLASTPKSAARASVGLRPRKSVGFALPSLDETDNEAQRTPLGVAVEDNEPNGSEGQEASQEIRVDEPQEVGEMQSYQDVSSDRIEASQPETGSLESLPTISASPSVPEEPLRRVARRRNMSIGSQTPLRRDMALKQQERRQFSSNLVAKVSERSGDLATEAKLAKKKKHEDPAPSPEEERVREENVLPSDDRAADLTEAAPTITPRKAKRRRTSCVPDIVQCASSMGTEELGIPELHGPIPAEEDSEPMSTIHSADVAEDGLAPTSCLPEADGNAVTDSTPVEQQVTVAQPTQPQPSPAPRRSAVLSSPLPKSSPAPATPGVEKSVAKRHHGAMTPAPAITSKTRHHIVKEGPASASRPLAKAAPRRKILDPSTREKRSQRRPVAASSIPTEPEPATNSAATLSSTPVSKNADQEPEEVSASDSTTKRDLKRRRMDTPTRGEIERKAKGMAQTRLHKSTPAATKPKAVGSRLATPVRSEFKSKAEQLRGNRAKSRKMETPLRQQIHSAAKKRTLRNETEGAGQREKERPSQEQQETVVSELPEQSHAPRSSATEEAERHAENGASTPEEEATADEKPIFEMQPEEKGSSEQNKQEPETRELEQADDDRRVTPIEESAPEQLTDVPQLEVETPSLPEKAPRLGKRKRKIEAPTPSPQTTESVQEESPVPAEAADSNALQLTEDAMPTDPAQPIALLPQTLDVSSSKETVSEVLAETLASPIEETAAPKRTAKRVAVRRKARVAKRAKVEEVPVQSKEEVPEQSKEEVPVQSKEEAVEPESVDEDNREAEETKHVAAPEHSMESAEKETIATTNSLISEDTVVDGKRIGDMICTQLRSSLKKRGLPTGGLKAALVGRLIDGLRNESRDAPETQEGEVREASAGEDSEDTPKKTTRTRKAKRTTRR